MILKKKKRKKKEIGIFFWIFKKILIYSFLFIHFWMGLLLHPPKKDDKYAQLTRGVFIINDFLQNGLISDISMIKIFR